MKTAAAALLGLAIGLAIGHTAARDTAIRAGEIRTSEFDGKEYRFVGYFTDAEDPFHEPVDDVLYGID